VVLLWLLAIFCWPGAGAGAAGAETAAGAEADVGAGAEADVGAGAEAERVLLWRLKPLGVEPELARRVQQLLHKEIERLDGVTPVAGERLAALLDERPELGTCGGATDCLAELGRASGARRVLSGVLGRLGATYSLDLKLVAADSGREVGRLAQTWEGADDSLIEVMRQVATRALRPDRYLGRVELEVSPPGVTVLVDGDEVGRTPLAGPLSLVPGRHAVKLQRPGYRDVERFVDVAFDRSSRLQIELRESSRREVVSARRVHRWWGVGLKAGLASNLDGFHAPQLELAASLWLPLWQARLGLQLRSGVWGWSAAGRLAEQPTAGRAVDGGLLVWSSQLGVLLRVLPRALFTPTVAGGAGLAVVWQRLQPEGFATQTFRRLSWTAWVGAGLELRLEPGPLLLQVRYQHLELDPSSAGGFAGRLGGLSLVLGYRLEL
jgi:hypothetical protein